jgi:hypothetical protein
MFSATIRREVSNMMVWVASTKHLPSVISGHRQLQFLRPMSDLRRGGPCFGERRALPRRPSSTSLRPAQRDHWASAWTPQTVLAARQGKVGGHVVVRRSQAANSRDYFWTLTRFEGLTHFKISDGKQHVGRKDLDNCSSLWPADWTVSRVRFARSTSDRDHR